MSPQHSRLRFPRLHQGLHPWSLRRFAEQVTKRAKPKDGFKKEGMRKQHLALTNGLGQGLNLKSS